TPPLRVNTHTAPAPLLSLGPPTKAVLPPVDSAMEEPCEAFPVAPVPTSLFPCWDQTPPLRVNTHTAPAPQASPGAPTMGAPPPAESATDRPTESPATAPLPTSLPPCWDHTPPLRVNTHAASGPQPPVKSQKSGPPSMAVLPSADNATEAPWCW